MNYDVFASSSGENLHKIDDGDLYIEFGIEGTTRLSERYKINEIELLIKANSTNSISILSDFIIRQAKI